MEKAMEEHMGKEEKLISVTLKVIARFFFTF